jgi:hypothetical protein
MFPNAIRGQRSHRVVLQVHEQTSIGANQELHCRSQLHVAIDPSIKPHKPAALDQRADDNVRYPGGEACYKDPYEHANHLAIQQNPDYFDHSVLLQMRNEYCIAGDCAELSTGQDRSSRTLKVSPKTVCLEERTRRGTLFARLFPSST